MGKYKESTRKCKCGSELNGKRTRCKACAAIYAKERRSLAVASKVRKVSIARFAGLPEGQPSNLVLVEHSADTFMSDFHVGPFHTQREADYYVALYLGAFSDHTSPASPGAPCNDGFLVDSPKRQCAFMCGHCETYTHPNITRWEIKHDRRSTLTRKVPLDQGGDCDTDDAPPLGISRRASPVV